MADDLNHPAGCYITQALRSDSGLVLQQIWFANSDCPLPHPVNPDQAEPIHLRLVEPPPSKGPAA